MGFYHRCTGITQRCVTTTATARAWRYTTPQSCVQIQLSCWWWDNGTSKYPPGEKGTRNLLSAAKRTPIDFWRDPLRSSVLSTICTILVRIPFVQDQFSPLHSALYFDQICVHILDLLWSFSFGPNQSLHSSARRERVIHVGPGLQLWFWRKIWINCLIFYYTFVYRSRGIARDNTKWKEDSVCNEWNHLQLR